MSMKKITIIIVMFCFLALPALAKDDDKNVDIKLKFGVRADGASDNQTKVSEYSALDKEVRPVVKAKIQGNSGKTYFNIFSYFSGSFKDMRHLLSLDFSRVLKQKFTFDSLYHRLDHDGLTNIDVVSHKRSAAYSEDMNPLDNYYLTHSVFESNTQLTIPGLSFMKFYVDFKQQQRKGQYQAKTLSKCSTCHVVAKTRSINNINRDIRVGSNFRVGKANVDYSFTHNQFTERRDAPTNDYLKIEHPESMKPIFTSRISYGNNVNLPFDVLPDSKKNTHLLKTAIPVSQSSTITAQYINANVKNEFSNLKWKTNSFAGGFSTLFGRKGFFNVRFQQLKIENDSIFIDMPEPIDVAGPKVGMTYAEAYGGNFDYLRNSSLSRTVLDIDANFRYRFNKKMRLKLGYEYKKVDRENFDVDTTTSNTFKASLKFRPVKQLRLTLDGKYKTVTDPFTNRFAATAPVLQTTAYPNPFMGVQFFNFQDARLNHLTNVPENQTEIKGRINWNASKKIALNGNIVYRTEKNDAINDNFNGIDAFWKRDSFSWGLDMWAVLSKKLPMTISYYNYSNQYESLFSIPIIEGCGAGIIQGMTGSLTDMFGYDIDTQTLLVNFHYMAGKKVFINLSFNYNKSKSEMVELALDETQVEYIPGVEIVALDYSNFGGVSEYSRLDMSQMIAKLGFNYKLNKSFALNGSFFYYFYDDMTDYLFEDTTGKKYSFFAGFSWSN